jgi:tRNA threonylcarbamoyladenosine biosynthesis protein TsaB
MATILLIETATEVCSVAISINGAIQAHSESEGKADHAAILTLQIQECCKQAGIQLTQLDAIGLSKGPGSYSSLRVGAAVAKGICYALNKPLIAVDTLRALALASFGKIPESHPDRIALPMLDARRMEVWMAGYSRNGATLFSARPFIFENNLFFNAWTDTGLAFESNGYILSGNGILKSENVPFLKEAVFSSIKSCSAVFLENESLEKFQNADFQNIAYFEPFYMKPPNITSPNKVF